MRAVFDICYTRAAFDEAVDEMHAVIERDPLSAYAHASLSVVLASPGGTTRRWLRRSGRASWTRAPSWSCGAE